MRITITDLTSDLRLDTLTGGNKAYEVDTEDVARWYDFLIDLSSAFECEYSSCCEVSTDYSSDGFGTVEVDTAEIHLYDENGDIVR